MPSRNTKRARKLGYSDMGRLRSGGEKNYGVKLGHPVKTDGVREEHGRKPWSGCKPTFQLTTACVVQYQRDNSSLIYSACWANLVSRLLWEEDIMGVRISHTQPL